MIKFTKKEVMLIELFILNKNKLIDKNKLITSVW
ncbi:MAG: helix-turn-helix domain-containing protein [Patescibacteria group bacterium]|nr:helix-turn-helix domain-containing protein [Patescibacteria group bacterium]